MPKRLSDIGEFAILDRLLRRLSESGLGDDCSFFQIGSHQLAVTADPGPAPLTRLLGAKWKDMGTWGWYAALASASDLAAAAAAPFFMTNCVLAPPTMEANDLDAYFAGFKAALDQFGFAHAGGDLSSGRNFRSVCTAVGLVDGDPLRRRGCRPGDRVAFVGSGGRFATAFLAALADPKSVAPKTTETLCYPKPRIREMLALRKEINLTAASDASDGLFAALQNIACASNCGFSLQLDSAVLETSLVKAADKWMLDPWALFSFWGDWQVVFTYPARQEPRVLKIADAEAFPVTVLGTAVAGPPIIFANTANWGASVSPLRNEHFSSTSYLFAGADDVVQLLRTDVFQRQ